MFFVAPGSTQAFIHNLFGESGWYSRSPRHRQQSPEQPLQSTGGSLGVPSLQTESSYITPPTRLPFRQQHGADAVFSWTNSLSGTVRSRSSPLRTAGAMQGAAIGELWLFQFTVQSSSPYRDG
ncbi:hypothetical protein OH76DRAFT_1490159 [Lentinus brumalis]|uniref:Uncharacterized protein n=1 Tax=Lentinus brumalis TaxID=2498619 RepID=A0A371CJW6_9APHY|nr:hypothetical protein OH76DRAFT_1490159 [Polyporus brumalis]